MSEGSPKRRSREFALVPAPGGGGKELFPIGSGEGLCTCVIINLVAGGGVVELGAALGSKAVLMDRCCRLRGGL